ncbi:prepilin peptidase [Tautonia sociabilis]|uniref:Prepilin leader peptidase/N-methyltransferase n=1 Tax=Tautonia sociabilis TaxID=2080755 RepID=A0A432MFT2_9BACT|nr:A24 family peptidase [Tautonia sociabilis]RUL85064.1 prepilin peptidase [Tautonia sociabilis]
MIWTLHAILLPLTFVFGALVGSFANVCIYRLPWEKSVVWPPSCCPNCLAFIRPSDNVPILGYLALRGRCRSCGLGFSGRYAAIELLVGLLFVAVYAVDVMAEPNLMYGSEFLLALSRAAYHATLVTLLVVATFIDYDYQIIPDSVTVTGMAIALIVGALVPEIRLEPASARTIAGGLGVGVLGLVVGGGVIYAVRLLGWVLFRKEGMGLGDVTLVAMIGGFLGWQVAPLTLFLGAIIGLVHGAIRLAAILGDRLAGRASRSSAIPFGPYLSLAALILMFGWRWLWPGPLGELFRTYSEVMRFLLGSALGQVVGGPG